MRGATVGVDDRLGCRRGYGATFQEVVDVFVADAQGRFVWPKWSKRFEVCGRHLLGQCRWRSQRRGDGTHPTLRKAPERRQVEASVAVLGEEAGHGFGSMVGSDNQP